jgi:thermitase
VIAVAATDRNDARWVNSSTQGSNYGEWVDVAAPGHQVLSTAPDHINSIWFFGVRYGTLSGTSMAAPHVAGVAGLIWSSGRCTAGDNACVRTRIKDGAEPFTDTGTNWTYRRVNANNSVAL